MRFLAVALSSSLQAGAPSASISGVGSSGAFGFLSRASAALSAATLVFSSRAPLGDGHVRRQECEVILEEYEDRLSGQHGGKVYPCLFSSFGLIFHQLL